MKWVCAIIAMGISLVTSGCYVPMPSVGITPPKVYHEEVCVYVPATDRLRCTHRRVWKR